MVFIECKTDESEISFKSDGGEQDWKENVWMQNSRSSPVSLREKFEIELKNLNV